MYQTVALLGDIRAGLRGHEHPRGGVVYAVRDGTTFLYIGKTIAWAWPHLRKHLRSDDVLGRAVRFAATSLDARKCCYLHDFRTSGLSDHAPIEAVFAAG